MEAVRHHWPVLLVLVVAALFRGSNLFPTFLYGDEAEYATVARSLAQDPRALAYPDLESFGPYPFVSQPPFILYLFALAGRLVGDVGTGAILVSAVLGTATCAVVYFLGVALQGRAAGAIAGTTLAVLPPHVDLSRRAMLDAGFVFFFSLAILAFILWSERRTWSWALATGAAAAATVLSKLPGVLVLPLLGGAFLFLVVRARGASTSERQAARRRDIRHAAVALLPVGWGILGYLALLWHLRAGENFFAKIGWQVGRVAQPAPNAGGRPTREWHWYFSDLNEGLPSFGWFVLLVAALGVGYVAWRAYRRPLERPRLVLVLVWTFFILAFFTASRRKEWFYLLPLAPAVVLLASLPLGEVAQRVWRVILRGGPRMRRVGTTGAAALTLLTALAVVPPAVDATVNVVLDERSFGYGVREAALWIDQRDPDAGQIGTLLGRFSLKYYNDHPTFHWFVPHAYVDEQIRAGEVRYLVWDDYLKLAYETEWFQSLVDTHSGRVVQEYETLPGKVRVRVYEFERA
jgi:4-amino-4-deoxy-L-arabinose transferase-like glycosyltransferase